MKSYGTETYGIGKAVRRVEDRAFITGAGQYTDDIAMPGMLRGYLLRSPHAHARFSIGNLRKVRKAPGVRLVLTYDDIAEYGNLPCMALLEQADGTTIDPKTVPLLCRDTVRHVGDAVAFIVAETLRQARDAAELLPVDYQPLPAAVDTEASLAADAPLVYKDRPGNLAFEVQTNRAEDIRDSFACADHISEVKVINNRVVSNFMEPRACIGEWSPDTDSYTLTAPSQGAFFIRDMLCDSVLDIDRDRLRVITPDVGGGFGSKMMLYRECPLVLIAAKKLRRPVKWTANRYEHFVADSHGRDHVTVARMAMDRHGRFLALSLEVIAASGAYLHTLASVTQTIGVSIGTGVYDIANAFMRVRSVYTNTVPTDAYRGAGRPEVVYAIERLVDKCALDLAIAPDAIRRLNMIRPRQMPYQTAFGSVYDSGEFEAQMDEALAKARWHDFARRAREAKTRRRIRGIGISTYIEACAFDTSEPAFVRLNRDGSVTIDIGTQSNGQGHKTAYAQVAAEVLQLDIANIEVRQGDTRLLDSGGGTGGSRSVTFGAVSVQWASKELANKIIAVAARQLAVPEAAVELRDGCAVAPGRSLSFAAVAESDELSATAEFKQSAPVYPNGTHICEVEIDPATGVTEIIRYSVVDDFGVTVNPLLLEGQIHGGIAQAIGQALMEHTVYAADGQMLTTSYLDYQLPRAADLPDFACSTRNVPSTVNALGIKGAGEAGTIGAAPAVINAVIHALYREYGITHIDMPATPFAVWSAIQQCSKGREHENNSGDLY